MASKKPRISYKAFKQLRELDEYIRQYDLRGDQLDHAAPDVFDGAVSIFDIEELHRHKWLKFTPYCRPLFSHGHPTIANYAEDICGESWTVVLTKNAIKRFWPDRLAAVQ